MHLQKNFEWICKQILTGIHIMFCAKQVWEHLEHIFSLCLVQRKGIKSHYKNSTCRLQYVRIFCVFLYTHTPIARHLQKVSSGSTISCLFRMPNLNFLLLFVLSSIDNNLTHTNKHAQTLTKKRKKEKNPLKIRFQDSVYL